jgi:hypothetical protein
MLVLKSKRPHEIHHQLKARPEDGVSTAFNTDSAGQLVAEQLGCFIEEDFQQLAEQPRYLLR